PAPAQFECLIVSSCDSRSRGIQRSSWSQLRATREDCTSELQISFTVFNLLPIGFGASRPEPSGATIEKRLRFRVRTAKRQPPRGTLPRWQRVKEDAWL